jgi:hypothetical protein
MVVTAGGPHVNSVVMACEDALAAPVRFDRAGGSWLRTWRSTATAPVLFQVGEALATSTHERFMVETFQDPVDGRLVAAGYGLRGTGTRAMAFHFQNSILPSAAVLDARWWIVEWVDAGADGPDSGDTFTVVASGG